MCAALRWLVRDPEASRPPAEPQASGGAKFVSPRIPSSPPPPWRARPRGFFRFSCRAVGGFPGVTVSFTASVLTASLFADQYCGADDTSLVMYVARGSVFDRAFTSKDTHSPRGELLVVHSSARASYRDSQLAKRTAFVLGSDVPPPSFTYGTDLMLPVSANADLRGTMVSGNDDEAVRELMATLTELDDLSAVPQVRYGKIKRGGGGGGNRVSSCVEYSRCMRCFHREQGFIFLFFFSRARRGMHTIREIDPELVQTVS